MTLDQWSMAVIIWLLFIGRNSFQQRSDAKSLANSASLRSSNGDGFSTLDVLDEQYITIDGEKFPVFDEETEDGCQ